MVRFTAICKLCLGCDYQITCNPSRRIWGLRWVRRRKDSTPGPAWPQGTHRALEGPDGKVWAAGPFCTLRDTFPAVHSPAGPHPPGMFMLPQAEGSIWFKTRETTHVTEQTLWVFPGQPAPRILGWPPPLKHPGTVCAVPLMQRPPPQES